LDGLLIGWKAWSLRLPCLLALLAATADNNFDIVNTRRSKKEGLAHPLASRHGFEGGSIDIQSIDIAECSLFPSIINTQWQTCSFQRRCARTGTILGSPGPGVSIVILERRTNRRRNQGV